MLMKMIICFFRSEISFVGWKDGVAEQDTRSQVYSLQFDYKQKDT